MLSEAPGVFSLGEVEVAAQPIGREFEVPEADRGQAFHTRLARHDPDFLRGEGPEEKSPEQVERTNSTDRRSQHGKTLPNTEWLA